MTHHGADDNGRKISTKRMVLSDLEGKQKGALGGEEVGYPFFK